MLNILLSFAESSDTQNSVDKRPQEQEGKFSFYLSVFSVEKSSRIPLSVVKAARMQQKESSPRGRHLWTQLDSEMLHNRLS